MAAEQVMDAVVERLSGIGGIQAIVLGGSRATGTHTAQSDIDVGIYYRKSSPLELPALGQAATELDDERRPDLLTQPGGWGPWINGGGWLKVGGIAVDFLYRELDQVENVLSACHAGQIEMAYQPGHPHGFSSAIYMGEVAYCKPLWDPHGVIRALKERTEPYPAALREALVQRFFWEAEFSLRIGKKGVARSDVGYVAGCFFRCLACLLQALFAHNGRYWLNEKGAVATAAGFARAPADLQHRVEAAFATLGRPAELAEGLKVFEALVAETALLLAS